MTPAGSEDVWCLDVPGMGAFVAEDVVVSNCYYACGFASHGRAGIPGKKSKKEDLDVEERDGSRGRSGYGESY